MGIFGRISATEHERVKTQRDTALTDLANEVEERARLSKQVSRLTGEMTTAAKQLEAADGAIAKLRAEISALKPDAEAMRAKRKRDREQKADKKASAAPKAPAKAPAKKGAGK